MSDNDINFALTVDKGQFDLIILLMLHDACHDFDCDKSSAAFKELFLLNKANPLPAINRIKQLKSHITQTGGMQPCEGIGEETPPLAGYIRSIYHTDPTRCISEQLKKEASEILSGELSEVIDIPTTGKDEINSLLDEVIRQENVTKLDSKITSSYIDASVKEYYQFLLTGKYSFFNEPDPNLERLINIQREVKLELTDVDFILRIIDKLTAGNIHIDGLAELFQNISEKYIKIKGILPEEDTEYLFEEVFRVSTNDFSNTHESIFPEELSKADEVFVTGTAAEVTPVGQIDNMKFKVGPVTKLLLEDYDHLVRQSQ